MLADSFDIWHKSIQVGGKLGINLGKSKFNMAARRLFLAHFLCKNGKLDC
jgi:hypothetical protein